MRTERSPITIGDGFRFAVGWILAWLVVVAVGFVLLMATGVSLAALLARHPPV